MKITLCGTEYNVRLVWTKYFDNSNTAIQAVNDEGPVATLTVNPGIRYPQTHVVIKDYSENEGALKSLIEADVIAEPTAYVQVGWATCPVCKVLERKEV